MFGDDLTAHLGTVRAEAESLLTDTCELQRKASRTIDPDTKQATDVWTTYRTSKCRLRTIDNQPNVSSVAGQGVTTVAMTVSVPLAVDDVQLDDRVHVTESGDPSLVGVDLYIKGIPRGTHQVLRRLIVTEVQ